MSFEDLQFVRGWNSAVLLMGNGDSEYRFPQIGGAADYMRGWNAAYSLIGVYPPAAHENVRRKPR
jgi:hypothetical protein